MMENQEQKAVDTTVKEEVKSLGDRHKEITIRTGHAMQLPQVTPVNMQGNIAAVYEYLRVRYDVTDLKSSFLTVNRENQEMTLVVDEVFENCTRIEARLRTSEMLVNFQINRDHSWAPEDLANMIKMSRTAFESKEVAMQLHSKLKNFRATVNNEIEKKNDDRGNRRALVDQVVNSNIPEDFVLNLPIFKGEESRRFKVEINIHPDNLECLLISPDLRDYEKNATDEAIDRELSKIKEIAPELNDLAIIEQ